MAYDAVVLFVERARQARPNFAVTDANAAAVAQICQRLDGIALALELAAARVRTLPVERLAVELDHRFRVLTGGARTALPRQRTLAASVDWSYDLLDDDEQTVLRRLGVFVGGFSLDAAETVCADEHLDPYDVLDLLTRLVDKSLVQLDDTTGRYRLLETVRQYALDRATAAGELPEIRGRHLAWCSGPCGPLGSGPSHADGRRVRGGRRRVRQPAGGARLVVGRRGGGGVAAPTGRRVVLPITAHRLGRVERPGPRPPRGRVTTLGPHRRHRCPPPHDRRRLALQHRRDGPGAGGRRATR